ncbi:MAG: hypothetical protein VKJ05_03085 [Synechococcaceae cyanobacterium]|nr:hypothetical protein [Synechococcaceae cyanobacterium]
MRTILCLQAFRASSTQRQKELQGCLAHNLHHPALAAAVVWVEPGAPPLPSGPVPLELRPLERRLRFADWLRLAAACEDAIVVLANADISLEEGFTRLERFLASPDDALALSRHEAATAARGVQLAADPHWRQDCWAIRSDAPIDADLLAAAELPLGRPGSDNRIAHVLWSHGFRLQNPALQLRTLHHQQQGAGSYDRSRQRLLGACTHVHPALAPGEASELEHRLWSRQPERSGGLVVQVEPLQGEAGEQPYLAAVTLPAVAAVAATPFRDRQALAALAARSRPLASHELAVQGPLAAPGPDTPPLPASAAGLFLPLAALAGDGSHITLLAPQQLRGIAVRLPLQLPQGSRLRLALGLAEGTAAAQTSSAPPCLELPLQPGRAGERLLLSGPWPKTQVAWLQLSLQPPRDAGPAAAPEAGGDPADQERFLELLLLVEDRMPHQGARLLRSWGDRFELVAERQALLARDRFWPVPRPLMGLRGASAAAWFTQAFVPPLLEWKPDWIPRRAGHGEARLHWQGAPQEAEARDRHARLAAAPPDDPDAATDVHTYLGLPWSTFLQHGSVPERLLAAYAERLRATVAVLAPTGRRLRVHTVCAAPDWQPLLGWWQALGIGDLWLVHPPAADALPPEITVHAWPALPGAGTDAAEIGATVPETADLAGRPLLLGPEPGAVADAQQEWLPLTRCRYALCPAGPAADPERLWRVLAAGAVPVLVGGPAWLPAARWLLPGLPQAWQEAVLVCREEERATLPERLQAIEPLAWRARQLLGGRLLRAAWRRTCWGGSAPPEARDQG